MGSSAEHCYMWNVDNCNWIISCIGHGINELAADVRRLVCDLIMHISFPCTCFRYLAAS